MSTTFFGVGCSTLVGLTVLVAASDRVPTEASRNHLFQQTATFSVEAYAFADGGQGCWQGPFECGGAYYDETPGNWGDAQVRPGTDVDLWYDDGGIVIGGLDGLEWLTFPVTVPEGGRYSVTFRTASPADRPAGSGVVNVGVYGVDGSWLGNQTVPVTGGDGEWHQYVTWRAPTTVYLPAGPQILTMWAAGGWYNVRAMTFTLETPPITSPGTIVFASRRTGQSQIYSVQPDGTNLTRLTNNPSFDYSPAWSPDGQRIAFVSDRDGYPEIYVMDADGTNVVRRTFSRSWSGEPCWSADGSRIVYATFSNGSVNIWSVSPDSGSPSLLLEKPGYDTYPALSPDGTRLAVTSDWYGYDLVQDIFIANADGSGWTGVTGLFDDNRADYYARSSWSPDSAKLALAIMDTIGIDRYVTKLAVMNADGSGLTPLISAAPWAKSSWSPDGATIAFTSESFGEPSISWVSATDGSKSGVIVTNGYDPDWRRRPE